DFVAVGFGSGLNYGAAGSFALKGFEVGAKIRGVLVAEIAVFLQGFVDDALEFFGNFVVEAHGRNGSPMQDAVENGGGRVALEGQNAGGHFVEHRAGKKKIGALIERFAKGLLWRHVGDGSHRTARSGEVVFGDAAGTGACRVSGWRTDQGELGETKIENLGVAARGDENVGGLDVA